VTRLEKVSTDPDRFFGRMVGSDDFKLRVGDCHLLALLSHSEKTITVGRVDHRSRIYKR